MEMNYITACLVIPVFLIILVFGDAIANKLSTHSETFRRIFNIEDDEA